MEPLPSFEAFWTFAATKAQQKNGLCYHKCCDIWTTRKSKFARASHNVSTTWAQFLSTLDRSDSDQKQVAQAKMIEDRMKIPVIMNKVCQCNSNRTIRPKRGRKPLQPSIQPEYNFGSSGAFRFTQPSVIAYPPLDTVPNPQFSTSPEKKEDIDLEKVLQSKILEFRGLIRKLKSKLNGETKARKALQTQLDDLLIDREAEKQKNSDLEKNLKETKTKLTSLEKDVQAILRRTDALENGLISEKSSMGSSILHSVWGKPFTSRSSSSEIE